MKNFDSTVAKFLTSFLVNFHLFIVSSLCVLTRFGSTFTFSALLFFLPPIVLPWYLQISEILFLGMRFSSRYPLIALALADVFNESDRNTGHGFVLLHSKQKSNSLPLPGMLL